MTSPPIPPIRTAILGYGVSGRFFHGAYLRVDPAYEVVLVATSDPGRAAQAREDHPGVHVIADPSDLAAHAPDLDLVVVCTPPSSHVELARTALQAGLDVVVDKPFAPTSAEGEELIALADSLGRRLSVYQNRRYDADFLTLQRLLAEGSLGEVHTFESRFEWWTPGGAHGWKGDTPVAAGGGILFDLGTHLLDQAVQLLGPVTAMLADVRSVAGGHGAPDDVAHLVLTHAGGATSRLSMSSLAALEGPRFHVSGDRAAWRSTGKDPQEAALRSGILPDAPGFGVEPQSQRGELGTDQQSTRTLSGTGDYGRYYRELSHALRTGGPVPVDPADAVAVLRLIEAAHAAPCTTFA